MWQSQDNTSNVEHQQKLLSGSNLDSGYGDSGFLSNFTSENLTTLHSREVDMKTKTSVEVITDSGLDIADDLSRIDLGSTGKEETDNNVQTPQVIQDHDMNNFNILYQVIARNDCIDKKVFDARDYMIQDEDGDTILHNAIIYSYNTQSLRLILNAPDPIVLNSVNKAGHTPLHLAVLAQQSDIVRLLVLSGAKLTSRSNDGNTPLHLACQLGNFECAKALLDPISLVEHAYHIKINNRITPIPQDLEIKNYTGQACLHVATKTGSVDVIRHLLRMGADLEAREGLSGRTALMIAITECKHDVVEFFLNECRPNFETENYAGLTAYQVALSVGNYQLADRLHAIGALAQPLPEVDYSSSDEDMEEDDDHVALNHSLDSDN